MNIDNRTVKQQFKDWYYNTYNGWPAEEETAYAAYIQALTTTGLPLVAYPGSDGKVEFLLVPFVYKEE